MAEERRAREPAFVGGEVQGKLGLAFFVLFGNGAGCSCSEPFFALPPRKPLATSVMAFQEHS